MKTRFFVPLKKEDCNTQVLFQNDDIIKPEISADDSFTHFTTDALLMQKFPTNSPFEKAIINKWKSNIILGQSIFNDSRFNPLIIPEIEDDELPLCIRFEFYQDSFSILSPEGEIGTYPYQKLYFPLIEPLETGFITPLLYGILENNKYISLSAGKTFVRVIDYRFSPEKRSIICLEITPQILKYFMDKNCAELSDNQKISIEKEIALISHPLVCIDPSPDVARVKSICDKNKKMWTIERERTENEFKVYKSPHSSSAKLTEFRKVKALGRIIPPKVPRAFPNSQPPDK